MINVLLVLPFLLPQKSFLRTHFQMYLYHVWLFFGWYIIMRNTPFDAENAKKMKI